MEKDLLDRARHSAAHMLAAAVLRLYPGTKLAIGPTIEDGFYYDFLFPEGVSVGETDLPNIESIMREIAQGSHRFVARQVSVEEALEFEKDQPFKRELIEEFAKEEKTLTLYESGPFTDLCRGGHTETTDMIPLDGLKLDRVAGAYWRGSEKNPMLTRIYGLLFADKKELDDYILRQEEAKRRDHRKIGQEQKLFFIDETVGKGLVMWLPNGTIIRDEIEKLAKEMESKGGYKRVTTPHLAKEELFLTSGHLPYYKDGMYPPMQMDDGVYYLRAMNCPHHHTIYRHEPLSYRDLPLRLAEYGMVYRNELSGTLAGLLRVRGLDMNDAHIYCRKDQIKSEFRRVLELTLEYFKIFDLRDYWFRLSKWDSNHLEKYINQPENWEYAEGVLREVLIEMGVPFFEASDEAAFYGPKVDMQFRSAVGREETMSTVQLDFAARERFKLSYIDEKGEKNGDVFVIHRAPLSTHERFTAFMIEHFAGAFPLWLSPEQVRVLPIADRHHEFAKKIMDELVAKGIRVEVDGGAETLGKKIRASAGSRVPYAVVVGDQEVETGVLSVRVRGAKDDLKINLVDFASLLEQKIRSREISL